MAANIVTAERLKELLDYDSSTGLFIWKVKKKSANIGQIAGTDSGRNSWQIKIDGKKYLAHRLAFLWMTGKFPENEVDHRNGDGTINAWSNLRECTRAQNAANTRKKRHNKSGFKGVKKCGSRSRASIKVDGCNIHLGYFASPREAHTAYLAAARHYFGEFANGGG